jgi:hypothetical protein
MTREIPRISTACQLMTDGYHPYLSSGYIWLVRFINPIMIVTRYLLERGDHELITIPLLMYT